jgi:hypothetical protein
MRALQIGVAVVLIAGIHSLAAQSPASDRGTATAAPRTDHALGYYDGRLRRVVLVGAPGDPKDGDRDSVWSWSGATWERLADAGPLGRVNAGGAYDARRGRAVVAGGSRKAADGATWEVVGDIGKAIRVAGGESPPSRRAITTRSWKTVTEAC